MTDRYAWHWVLEFVVCPSCRGPLTILESSPDGRDAVLGHAGNSCAERYPVIDAVSRLLVGEARAALARDRHAWFSASPLGARFSGWSAEVGRRAPDLRLVARFDHEWRTFAQVGTSEQQRLFEQYFDIVPRELLGTGRIALDAGCGAGRWAYEVQRHGSRVVAVDLGRSIEVAERNTRDTGRVACVQADVRDLPVSPARFDLVYSLGVLHHIGPTEEAVRRLADLLGPGGALLIYLYYALDSRSPTFRALFRASDALRQVSSRLPQPALVALSTAIAALVYYPLARAARVLHALGRHRLARAIPLSFYAGLSFETMRNDSLDRFGTNLEKRFTKSAVRTMLLDDAGLTSVAVSDGPPFWHALGRRSRAER